MNNARDSNLCDIKENIINIPTRIITNVNEGVVKMNISILCYTVR